MRTWDDFVTELRTHFPYNHIKFVSIKDECGLEKQALFVDDCQLADVCIGEFDFLSPKYLEETYNGIAVYDELLAMFYEQITIWLSIKRYKRKKQIEAAYHEEKNETC